MNKLFVAFAIGSILLSPQTSYAADPCSIPADQAKSSVPVVPPLKVGAQAGLNINFIPVGELVKKVWLDDISQIGIDFDGQLCEPGQECQTSGASIIHLRRIAPLDVPGMPKPDPSKPTLLTVVTETARGEKNLYHFPISYRSTSPRCFAVSIVPQVETITTVQTPPVEASPMLSLSHTPKATRSVANPPRTTRPPTTTHHQVRLGLAVAQKQGLISSDRRNLYLKQRVTRYLSFLEQGDTSVTAAKKSKLPLHFIDTLQNLGRE